MEKNISNILIYFRKRVFRPPKPWVGLSIGPGLQEWRRHTKIKMKIKIKHNTTTEKPSTVASCIFRVAGETRCWMVVKRGEKGEKRRKCRGWGKCQGGENGEGNEGEWGTLNGNGKWQGINCRAKGSRVPSSEFRVPRSGT